jgi:N6-adenosine-specific RNA methylase IME4
LAVAKSIREVKNIADQAEAAKVLCRKANLGFECVQEAAEIAACAQRKAGEMLSAMEKQRPGEYQRLHDATVAPSLSDLGIEKTQSHRWQRIASLPEEVFHDYIERCKANGSEITSSGLCKLAKKTTATSNIIEIESGAEGVVDNFDAVLASGEAFATIYADPPWRYGNQATRASTDNHYQTMTVEDIAAIPVAKVVEPKALLFLWTTNGFLFESKQVIDAWGFEFKSAVVWVKPQMGIGNYVRNAHEYLLICSRGGARTAPAGRSQISWISAKRGKHSSKPAVFRDLVERLSIPNRLEMFGRETVPGWTVFGNQVQQGLC